MNQASVGNSTDRLWYLLITILVLIGDQLTKYWVATTLQAQGDITVVRGLVTFSYTENRGIAFGMLNDRNMQWFLVFISIAAICVVIFYLLRASASHRIFLLSLALLAGGIAGNLVDRIRLGKVIDFIEVYYRTHQWPVFNLADTAISIGAILLALDLFFSPHTSHKPIADGATLSGGTDHNYAQEPVPASVPDDPPASA